MPEISKAMRYRRPHVKKAFHRFTNYWLADTSFVLLFFILLFLVFVMPILIDYGYVGNIFVSASFLFLFFTGIWSTRERGLVILTTTLFLSQLILRIIRFSDLEATFYELELFVGLLNMIVFIFLNIRLLFRDNEVNLYRVFGAVNVYLLVAVLGAFSLDLIHIYTGSSIQGAEGLTGAELDFATFIYFSLVSLTTVGYGDIYPVQIIAKMLAVFLSTIGILYPAVVIAKLVSSSK
ncbi:potassium channel family protein [Algoriphagus namhaensis]|uniref:Potassium channel family protein n=1 Tax=Algoriphagus namhaensis TaxID=915353 RepID=A0ABV8ATX8_9BACT